MLTKVGKKRGRRPEDSPKTHLWVKLDDGRGEGDGGGNGLRGLFVLEVIVGLNGDG